MEKLKTARALGISKSDFVHTGTVPGILIDKSNKKMPVCEIWGFEHTTAQVYACEMVKISYEEFLAECLKWGYKHPSAITGEARSAISRAINHRFRETRRMPPF